MSPAVRARLKLHRQGRKGRRFLRGLSPKVVLPPWGVAPIAFLVQVRQGRKSTSDTEFIILSMGSPLILHRVAERVGLGEIDPGTRNPKDEGVTPRSGRLITRHPSVITGYSGSMRCAGTTRNWGTSYPWGSEETAAMAGRYLEDFAVGQTFGSGRLRVEKERIKSFAAEFDPQPFHLDEDAARRSILGGLAASGWHTAALTMRLLVESDLRPAGGIVGAGFDEFRWPRPVRPGDELHVESEILEVRPSRSRPEQGLVKVKTTTKNQNGEPVQVSIGNLVVPRRPK
jgi:acyl dehydratase